MFFSELNSESWAGTCRKHKTENWIMMTPTMYKSIKHAFCMGLEPEHGKKCCGLKLLPSQYFLNHKICFMFRVERKSSLGRISRQPRPISERGRVYLFHLAFTTSLQTFSWQLTEVSSDSLWSPPERLRFLAWKLKDPKQDAFQLNSTHLLPNFRRYVVNVEAKKVILGPLYNIRPPMTRNPIKKNSNRSRITHASLSVFGGYLEKYYRYWKRASVNVSHSSASNIYPTFQYLVHEMQAKKSSKLKDGFCMMTSKDVKTAFREFLDSYNRRQKGYTTHFSALLFTRPFFFAKSQLPIREIQQKQVEKRHPLLGVLACLWHVSTHAFISGFLGNYNS